MYTVPKSTVPKSYIQLMRFLFSGSGVWAIMAVAVLAIAGKTLWGAWSALDAIVLLFFFIFRGVIEWVIHSWLYHANRIPVISISLKTETHRQHIYHHENPSDLSHLLITFKGVLVLGAVFFLGPLILTRSLDFSATVVLSFMLVGLTIESLHLVCHSDIAHTTRVMKRLVWLHRYHHEVDGKNFYGVSSSFGDRIFGTYPSVNEGKNAR
ncbi:MAG: sterol desaturase family protein [Alcanivorax sp.]|nr:sterol desaturase family protein [Alcanivorax sp.]